MAFDFKKEYKEFYLPKNQPGIVTVPAMNFAAVRGCGDPNEENGAYQQAIGVLSSRMGMLVPPTAVTSLDAKLNAAKASLDRGNRGAGGTVPSRSEAAGPLPTGSEWREPR